MALMRNKWECRTNKSDGWWGTENGLVWNVQWRKKYEQIGVYFCIVDWSKNLKSKVKIGEISVPWRKGSSKLKIMWGLLIEERIWGDQSNEVTKGGVIFLR